MSNNLNKLGGRLVYLELAGLNGNVFNLFAKFSQAARRQGFSREEVQAVLDEARTSDYDHALRVLIANTTSQEPYYEEE